MLSRSDRVSTQKTDSIASIFAKTAILLCCFASHALAADAFGNQRPYPQALTYAGKIKPSHVTQAQMNASVASYYSKWKSSYVRQSSGATPGGGYYVEMQGTGGSGTEITTSEAHGYGMIVFALMAGQDSSAKKYFDGMYNMYDKHRSKTNRNLMSWMIDRTESTSKDSSSATDGDMDIAYALLLAHYQWGSSGAINYLAEAKRIINSGLKGDDVHSVSKRTKLGDWDDDQWSTRASDWMAGHMRAYYAATQDPFWNDASNTVYSLIDAITKNYSSSTGLMPDFVVGSTPKPAAPNFLEADTDDDYSWNSCRYPLRIAMDAAHFQNAKAKTAMTKVVSWVENSTGGNPAGIMAGYRLNGSPLVGYDAMAFTAPFVAAATVATGDHQRFVNAGWDLMVKTTDGYYSDSINLLSLLFISGNWWAPVDNGNTGGGDTGGGNPGSGNPGGGNSGTITVSDSGNDGHVAANLLDGKLDAESRWSAFGKGQWVEFDLGSIKKVQAVEIAFLNGTSRRASFTISLGKERGSLTQVFSGQSSGQSNALERFDIADTDARYIRITGNGNTVNDWNSYTEVKFTLATAGGGGPVTPPPVSGVIKYNPYSQQHSNWYKGITHSHTKAHDGNAEGTTPEKMAQVYKNAGYDFVALTDHDTYTKPANVSGIVYIPGQEVSVNDGDMNVFGITRAVTPYRSGQQTINEARSYGDAMVQVNHPLDSDAYDDGRLLPYLSSLTNLWGVEVYNGGRPGDDAVAAWDHLLSQGKQIWATAGDDAHAVNETGRDWIVVNAPSNTQENILASMRTGNFYATQGPDLKIRISNNMVYVSTTKGKEVKWYKSNMKLIKTTNVSAGAEDTYTIQGDEGFVRVLITDGNGKKAVSQPIFVKKASDTNTGGGTPPNTGGGTPITGTLRTVASTADFDAIESLLKPGDGVLLKAGSWNNQKLSIDVSGTADKPIIIKAESDGKTIFTGSSSLVINGDYVEVHGLRFSGSSTTKPTVVSFGPESDHSRFSNSVIEGYNPSAGGNHTWVFIDGQYNRVDHNVLTGKRGSGQTLRVWRNGKEDHHRIDHNVFLDRTALGENGGETIQIGVSKYQTSASYTTIEDNYFESCDGEVEIISVKSGKNIVRNNTLVRNAGTITLRHGHESVISGNYIFAGGKAGAGGIRVYGYDHQIYNNYFDGINERSSTLGGVAIHSGDILSRTDTSTGTIPAVNTAVMHNTFVNSAVAFVFGSNKQYQPSGIRLYNNLIAKQKNTAIYDAGGLKSLSSAANYYDGSLGVIVSGFSKQNTELESVQRNGYTVWKPGSTSKAVNAGDNTLTVAKDIDGVTRTATPDIGAHEFGTGARMPLQKQDVGASWYW